MLMHHRNPIATRVVIQYLLLIYRLKHTISICSFLHQTNWFFFSIIICMSFAIMAFSIECTITLHKWIVNIHFGFKKIFFINCFSMETPKYCVLLRLHDNRLNQFSSISIDLKIYRKVNYSILKMKTSGHLCFWACRVCTRLRPT